MSHGVTGPLTGGRVSYLFIMVHDVQRMLSFYHHTLGFEIAYLEEGHNAFLRLGPVDGAPLTIALQAGRDAVVPERSHWFFVIDVADIESAVERLRSAGVEVGEIHAVPYGRAAVFRDPEGNVIEVHELDGEPE